MSQDLSAFLAFGPPPEEPQGSPRPMRPHVASAPLTPPPVPTPRPVIAVPQRAEPVIETPTLINPAPMAQFYPPAPAPQALPPQAAAITRRKVMGIAMPKLGIIDALMKNEDVHDILINGTHGIFIDVNGRLENSGLRFNNEDEVWNLVETIISTMGQHWSDERPMIDTRLPDGSRVNIVAPPMSVDGVTISIRKFPAQHVTLERMVERDQLIPELAEFLKNCTRMRLNIIVAGGTSSGKTTLLNALSSAIAAEERIVTIEDSAELRLQQPHVVRLETKPAVPGQNQYNGVSIRDLVRNALRMRPDRIIVGESRGAEAFDVIQAMNTGHDGSMTTLHANNPRDALTRLETMVSMALTQQPSRIVRQQIASTVHLIVQMQRGKDGQRRITHVSEIAGMEGDTIMMQDLITFVEAQGNRGPEYRWVATSPRNPAVTEAARNAGMLRGLR